MSTQVITTEYKLPQSTMFNGQLTGHQWKDTDNLYLLDNNTAQSDVNVGASSDVTVGNFQLNIPVGSIITGIKFKVFGYVDSITVPPTTIQFNAINPITGDSYPYSSTFNGFTQSMAEYEFGSENYLFGHDWTVDEINNFRIQLVANGSLYVDTVMVEAYYYTPATPGPEPVVGPHCATCESQIQGVEYFLALEMKASDTSAYVYEFNYADGEPIQIGDVGDCGGSIDIVIDEGKVKGNGQPFMENAKIGNITRLANGLVKLDFVNITNRGLQFKTPYTHDPDLLSEHNVNAKVIISNSAPFYNKFLKKCHVDVFVSAPIDIQQNSLDVVTSVHDINFEGPGVLVNQDPIDDHKATITILGDQDTVGAGSTSSGTTGSSTASSLTYSHTATGSNRLLRVSVITQETATITSVTYGGVPLTLVGVRAYSAGNIRVALYQLVAPTVGTDDVVVTMSTTTYITSQAITFVNVDQVTPTAGVSGGNEGNSGVALDSLVTVDNNILIQDVVGASVYGTTFAQYPSQYKKAQTSNANRPGATSVQYTIGTGTFYAGYNINPAGYWAILMAGIKGVTTGSGPTGPTGPTGPGGAGSIGPTGYTGYTGPAGSGGGETADFTASQDLVIGDPIGTSNGKSGYAGIAGYVSSAIESSISSLSPGIDTLIQITEISLNKFAMIYVEKTSLDKKVVVFDMNPGTYELTFGTPVTYTTKLAVNSTVVNITTIDTNKFLIGLTSSTDSWSVFGIVGTVSGTTITLGSETLMYTQTADSSAIAITSSNTNTALFTTYRRIDSGVDIYIEARGVTISGTTITTGSSSTVTSMTSVGWSNTYSLGFPSGTYLQKIAKVDTNKVFIPYTHYDTPNPAELYGVVITQSGTSITVGTPVLLISGSSSGDMWVSSLYFSTNKLIAVYYKGFQYASVIISISGTTPSIGTPISDSFSMVSFTDGTSVWLLFGSPGYYLRYTVSGSNFVATSDAGFSPAGYQSSYGMIKGLSGEIYSFYPDLPNNLIKVPFFGQASNFIGIALNNASKGNTVTVQLAGKATINQDVNSGNNYIIQNGQFNLFYGTEPVIERQNTVKGAGLNSIII